MQKTCSNQEAQSTLEYMLLLAAVVTFFIIFLGRGGSYQGKLQGGHLDAADEMTVLSERLKRSVYTPKDEGQ